MVADAAPVQEEEGAEEAVAAAPEPRTDDTATTGNGTTGPEAAPGTMTANLFDTPAPARQAAEAIESAPVQDTEEEAEVAANADGKADTGAERPADAPRSA